MRFYLGIDGGQSSTTALIADETGKVIGRGRGGACNHAAAAEGRAKFLSAVGSCLSEACGQARLDPASLEFAAVCLGFSGGAEDKKPYARELIRSRLYKITHDAEIALIGATGGEPGIIVIAGTGSIAFGRNATLEIARAGGWGYIFGDEGGAFDLARQALRAALRHEEGWGQATELRALLLQRTGAHTANELMHSLYAKFDRTQVATLADLVTQAAGHGDAAAMEIVQHAADQLAYYVEGAYRRLFPEGTRVPVSPIGGAFQSTPLREQFARSVERSIGCPTVAPRLSPAEGALVEALRLDGNAQSIQPMAP